MSHSTTVTETHVLLKYSKSHSQSVPYTSSDSNGVNPDAEWQHFVNPVIRLFLDFKKSLQGEFESVRLRISWSMNSGGDSMDVDQRDVVFEDLDLLAFSPLASFKPQQKHQTPCLPLKAVYRDAVVGIRYLHPRVVPLGCRPVYRRFQMTFMSTAAASQFIDSIRNVCPCKANSAPDLARNMTINLHPVMGPAYDKRTGDPPPPDPKRTNPTVAKKLSVPDSSPPSSSLNSSQGAMLPPPPPSSTQNLSQTAPPSVPNSSQRADSAASQDSFLTSLRETPALYQLSHTDLEKLVGDVVREDGFAKLLENLDSMWKVKGFLEH